MTRRRVTIRLTEGMSAYVDRLSEFLGQTHAETVRALLDVGRESTERIRGHIAPTHTGWSALRPEDRKDAHS